MAFVPPKPDHRKLHMKPMDVFKIAKKDMLAMFPREAYSYLMGRYRLGLVTIFTINCLPTARKILVESHADYPKSRYMMRMLYPLMRDAFFTRSGAEWRKIRQKLNPSFSHLQLQRAFPKMKYAVERLLKRLDKAAAGREIIDIERELSFVTADVIFRIMFSINLDGEDARIIFDNFQTYQRALESFGLSDIFSLPSWVPKFKNENAGKAGAAADTLRAVAEKIVRQRMNLPYSDQPDDMLKDILHEYGKEYGAAIPVEEIVDQLCFFFLAGHETLASATTWGIYLLAMSQDHADKIRHEVQARCGDSGVIEFPHLRSFEMTAAVYKETLRLYPSVPYFTREATKADTLRGHKIKPGDQLSISPYFIHRHERYWNKPDEFRPERFLKGQEEEAVKTAYLPFSEGSRICPGASFSNIEAVLIFAELTRRYKFTVAVDHVVEPLGRLTLRPKNGMKMIVERL